MSERFVKYGDKRMPVDDGMTLDQIKTIMARHFPELADPKVETKKDGETTVYVFSKQAGRKGVRHTLHNTVIANLGKIEAVGILPAGVLEAVTGNGAPMIQGDASILAESLDNEAAQVNTVAQSLLDIPPFRPVRGMVL